MKWHLNRHLLLAVVLSLVCWVVWRQKDASPPPEADMAVPGGARQHEGHPVEGDQDGEGKEPQSGRLRDLLLLGEGSNEAISFFGRVVDEKGEPLEDVQVIARVLSFSSAALMDGEHPQASEDHVLRTDSAGDFSLSGARGYTVIIASLQKEGYRPLGSLGGGFSYDSATARRHQPDPDNPVVFSMWRERGGENGIIAYRRTGRVPYDGSEVFLDLEKGRLNQGRRDLRVSLLREPLVVARGREKFDWILRVEALDGGVAPVDESPGWEAPEAGYVPVHDLVMLADAPDWERSGMLVFFVKARGGALYGRVSLSVTADSDRPTTGFIIDAQVNPNGSRNLERARRR